MSEYKYYLIQSAILLGVYLFIKFDIWLVKRINRTNGW
jgi:hypothetical protein